MDLKQCHRYLLNELLAARTRPGQYGGSFENRTRFIREVVGRIRDENPGGLIATRLNVFDGIPFQPTGRTGRASPAPFTTPVRSAWGTREDDPFDARPGRADRPGRPAPATWASRWSTSRWATRTRARTCSGRSSTPPSTATRRPSIRLIGVDRHFRLTAAIQAAYPDLAVVGSGYSWLQAFAFQAGAANVARRPGDVRRRSAGARSRSPTSAGTSCRASRSTRSGPAGPSATARP